jgi:hypothetical protein
MQVTIAPRSPRLAPFVASLGYYESALPPGRDRVLPNGTMGLMINLEQDEFRTYHGPRAAIVRRSAGAVLSGPDPRAIVIDTLEQRRGLSVSFTIGGAAPFFALPFGETTGELVGLGELWGRDGAVLPTGRGSRRTTATAIRRISSTTSVTSRASRRARTGRALPRSTTTCRWHDAFRQ